MGLWRVKSQEWSMDVLLDVYTFFHLASNWSVCTLFPKLYFLWSLSLSQTLFYIMFTPAYIQCFVPVINFLFSHYLVECFALKWRWRLLGLQQRCQLATVAHINMHYTQAILLLYLYIGCLKFPMCWVVTMKWITQNNDCNIHMLCISNAGIYMSQLLASSLPEDCFTDLPSTVTCR